MITAQQVAQLRAQTGAGLMDAKKALTEAAGDLEKAHDILRTSGALKVAKKADRLTAEGRIETYLHTTGKTAVLVEVMCETDFVARNDQFLEFCHDIALHITAFAPQFVTRAEVPANLVEREIAIVKEQLLAEGKPEAVQAGIITGKLDKFYKEIVLMEQSFVKDDSITITDLLQAKITAIGENIKIGRMVRMQLGE